MFIGKLVCNLCYLCKKGILFCRLFALSCGNRQEGVLSPYLVAMYIDNLVDRIRNCPFGCFINNVCMSILLYAGDILPRDARSASAVLLSYVVRPSVRLSVRP